MRFDPSVEDRRGDAMHNDFDLSNTAMVDRRVFMNNLNNEFDRRNWEKVCGGGGGRWQN